MATEQHLTLQRYSGLKSSCKNSKSSHLLLSIPGIRIKHYDAYLRNNLTIGQHTVGLSRVLGSSTSHLYCTSSCKSHDFKSPSNPFLFRPCGVICAREVSSEAGKASTSGAITFRHLRLSCELLRIGSLVKGCSQSDCEGWWVASSEKIDLGRILKIYQAKMIRTLAEINGARLLKEIEVEQSSLEDLLKDLRNLHHSPQSKTGLPALDALIPTQPKTTTISGRHLPLLYHLLYHQIHVLNGTVCLLDLTATFSPSHLISSPSRALTKTELQHLHVFPCTKANLQVTLKALEDYMFYSVESRASRGREWVATIVLGGHGGDFAFGWKGLLRVEKVGEGIGFGAAISVEEAIAEERRRSDGRSVSEEGKACEVEGKRWRVVGESGSYSWQD